MTIQKLFCKIMLRSFVLILGLISVTELSANPEFAYSASSLESSVTAPQGGGNVKMTGRVLDETKAGVPGATVIVKGSTRGVITGNDGTFSIDVKPTDVIEISYLGYETQSIPVGTKTNIVTELVRKVSELEAVTVVAYGKQRKESIIGAINTIDAGELEVASGSLSSNLAGKLAGIVVMQRTGEPGSSAEFWIRGQSTFGAKTTPLVLVDGIERDMDFVDADDIATFSILKDATATALYGVRGANGIILITTKRGTEMTAPQIRVKAEFGITQPVQLPELANASQWIDYYNELYRDSGSTEMPISDYARQMYLSGRDPDLYPNVDWVNTIFKDLAMTGRVHASVTGGSPKIRYYVSASYYTEGGMFNVADNDRYNAQMNFNKYSFRSNIDIDIDITKSTQLGLSLSTQYTTKNAPCTTTNDLYAYTMYVTPVATPTVFSNGMLAIPQESGSVNPYNMLNNTGYRRYNTMVAQSLLSLTQDFSDIITPGLKANVKFAWDAQNATLLERAMSPVTYYATGRDENGELMLTAANPNGSNYMRLATSDSSGTTAINFEGSLIYERLFAEDHRVSGMFLYSVRSKSKNRPVNYIDAYPTKNMGIAGRFTYAFRDKYFAEFNFGYNGSENFAPGKRYGFFPSYAVGYMISNEKFWEPLRDKVNILKIRASYGKIGNDEIGGSRRFAYNTTMNTNAGGFTFGDLGQTNLPGYSTGEYGNPDVAWEEATKADVGIELGLFNKIKIQADYFYEKREGIFIQRESTPSVVGTKTAQWVNLGRMKNQGFDMSLEFDHSFNKDFSISARGNFTYNRNKKLYDDKPDQIWKYQNLAGFANNQQFGLIAEGLFESEEDIANWPKQDFGTVRPGDIKYRDVNGDGVVNTFDKVAIGYTLVPEINYGFGASLKWKGIDVSVFFSGVGHVTRIIQGQNLFGASSTILRMGQIFEDVAKNRWTLDNQNPNAPYPRLSLNKVDNNQQLSTYWQRDMSFLRLKDAEIGYTLPESMTKKWGLSKIRFYIQGKNLITFSDFKLWDPEVNANYGNVYPLIRTFAIGANVNF